MTPSIRPARPEDGPALQAIERRAGTRFRDVGMPEIADDEPLPLDVLARYADEGRSWVAVDYRRLGFRDLAEDELGPELCALRDSEAGHGLDPTIRVCMRRCSQRAQRQA